MVAWALMATAAPRHAMDRGALRRAGAATLLRDLIALSALPAIWKTYDPQQIADNLAAALVIAVTKAVLVALVFMHVRQSGPVTRLFVGAGLIWLLILIGLTLTDYLSRAWGNSFGI